MIITDTNARSFVKPRAGARDPNPDLPTAQIEGIFKSGKISVATADRGVKVLIPRWADVTAGHRIYLTVNGNESANRIQPPYVITLADVADPDKIFELPLPASYTVDEGTILVSYTDTTATNSNPKWPLKGVNVIVDRTAPGGQQLPILLNGDGTQIIRTLTEADLVAGQFDTLVADYDGIEENDVITPYIIPPGETDPVFLTGSEETVDEDEVHTNRVHLFFDKADLEPYGDGQYKFGFKIKDEPGNESILSPEAIIHVILFDLPEGLLEPVVPAFKDATGAGDGVVSYDDAVAGVEVQIPAYTTPAEGDVIQVNWGGRLSTTYPLDATDIANDPVTTFTLTRDFVVAVGSNPTLPVLYTVTRAGLAITSPTLPVNVDLTVPGEPDPERFLQLLTILGPSNQPNLIDESDYGQNATATIPNRTDNVPPVPAYIAGDIVTVIWNGVPVLPGYIVSTGDNAQPLRLPIPASFIVPPTGPGAGIFDVTYSIRRELQPPYTPPQYSTGTARPTSVQVKTTGALPNDGNPMDAPEFTNTNDDGVIDQAHAVNGAPLRCSLDVTNIAVNDKIEVLFRGYEFNPPSPEVVAARYELSDELTALSLINKYYDLTIPRENLRLLCQGYGRVTYTLTNANGSTTSLEQEVVIDLSDATNPFCLLP